MEKSGHGKKGKNMLPRAPQKAEKFLARLWPDEVGQSLWDSAEPALQVVVGKRVAAWRVRIKVAGKWTPITLGQVGKMGIREARSLAQKVRAQGAFESQEQLYELLGRTSSAAPLPDTLSVLGCFDAATAPPEDGSKPIVLKDKSINRYRAALRATGPEFYNLSISLPTAADLRAVVTAFRREKRKSKTYTRNLVAALSIAYEYAIDQHEQTGVEENLAKTLKNINFDVTDKPSKRTNLEWPELRALWGWLCDPRCPLTRTQIRLYKTMLLVGERMEALRTAEWDEIGDDGWWVIPPHKRKLPRGKAKAIPPVYIKITELLREILGQPDGSSRYIFPSESDPNEPYPHGSEPLWNLFRVRAAVRRGVTIESLGTKVTVPSPISSSMNKATAKRERNLIRRYAAFLVPDIVPGICHHEMGRHTIATLAQEECIPGTYVSDALGHANDKAIKKIPLLHHSAFAHLDRETPPEMPRALQRQAAALATTGRTAKEHYTHIKNRLRGIEATWIFWTAAFCREVIGETPPSIADARDQLLGPDDKLISLFMARFNGDLAAALQHVRAGHYKPTHHCEGEK
jgi:hypothetical protein